MAQRFYQPITVKETPFSIFQRIRSMLGTGAEDAIREAGEKRKALTEQGYISRGLSGTTALTGAVSNIEEETGTNVAAERSRIAQNALSSVPSWYNLTRTDTTTPQTNTGLSDFSNLYGGNYGGQQNQPQSVPNFTELVKAFGLDEAPGKANPAQTVASNIKVPPAEQKTTPDFGGIQGKGGPNNLTDAMKTLWEDYLRRHGKMGPNKWAV